ncbi:MAG: CHASE domain-containing protein [Acidobacteria bacterium]|nr:CHASE domain-containing protein [Acidobacteriota bacterium]
MPTIPGLQGRPRSGPAPWFALLAGLLLTLALWSYASRQVRREARAAFEAEVQRIQENLRGRLEAPVVAMEGCYGLFDASGTVRQEHWKAFVRRLNPRQRFPGMRSLGYAAVVREGETRAFEARATELWGLPVRLHGEKPLQPRPLHFPLLFMEPELLNFRNELLGIDLAFEPLRAEALLRAVRTGTVAATRPVTLRGQDTELYDQHPGVILYLPVYKRNLPAATPEEREAAVQGVVYGSFLSDLLIGGAARDTRDIAIRVEDRAAGGGPRLLDTYPAEFPAGGWGFERAVEFPIGQRIWVMQCTALPGFGKGFGDWGPPTILATGLVFTGLLFAFVRTQQLARGRAEELARALRDSETRFRMLANTTACIIVLYSDVIEYVNDFGCQFMKMKVDDILGKPFWSFVHPHDRDMVKQRGLARIRGEQVSETYEFRLVDGEGEVHWVDFTAGKIAWGERTLGMATVFDVTERVRAVEARLQIERKMFETQRLESLGLLAGGIAHDFNNLLGAVLGHVSLAKGSLPADHPGRRHIETIRETTLHAANLSRQLLAYSGRGTFVVEPLDLNQHVRDIRSLLDVSVSKDTAIRLELQEPLPTIQGDAGQLHQVVMNLVTNAAEAMEGPGEIKIRTSTRLLGAADLHGLAAAQGTAPGSFVCLEVADQGRGMDEATLAKIFDPFFSTKFAGRGLGLAAMQGIVQGHRGAIQVESEPGKGSRFRVFFPAQPSPAAPPPARGNSGSQAPLPASGGSRILLVEDEEALAEATMQILQRAGHEVVWAQNGAVAIERFLEGPDAFSLVLLDLTMPVMDGRECFRRLRQLRADLKVILASGWGGQEAGEAFGEGQLSGFLQKPYRGRDLLRAVAEALAPGA